MRDFEERLGGGGEKSLMAQPFLHLRSLGEYNMGLNPLEIGSFDFPSHFTTYEEPRPPDIPQDR
jgi:hypothetical protein